MIEEDRREPGVNLARSHQHLHDEVQQLLPWLVNESLSPRETDAVLAHLRACPACRADRDRLQHMVSMLEEDVPGDQDYRPSYRRLIQRIESTAPMASDAKTASWLELASVRGGFALVASLVIAIGGAVWLNRTPADDSFVTLADPVVASVDRITIRMLFADDIEQSLVRDVLVSIEANIVSGPDRSGYLLVTIPKTSNVETVINGLATAEGVERVERIPGA